MSPLAQTVEFDADLITQYNRPLPRYTSYPPATELTETFDPVEFNLALATGNYQQTPISLYCHLPFCNSACYFCGCNTIITQNKAVVDPYLAALIGNIEQVAALSDPQRVVNQMHWGGGTPNYLSLEQAHRLMQKLKKRFSFADDAEISIEVSPRYLTRDYVLGLRLLGFNRISFGIQDFNPQVQTAINRPQSEEMLFQVMSWIREARFQSVNVDFIYGLPYQTLETFHNTIRKTLMLNPDRIAIFNFAYLPHLLPIQRKHIDERTLPAAAEKLDILHMSIDELTAGGYQFIGMDHFAKPNDELTLAQNEGRLHRNFQGYTTQPEADLFAFGMTAISMAQHIYTQNHKQLKDFSASISANTLPLKRGLVLSHDDRLRRAVIMELMCQFELSKSALEEKYHLSFDQDFDDYFAHERQDLEALSTDGLVSLTPNHIQVTPSGRLLIRNIAAVFDVYLRDRSVSRPKTFKNRQFSQSV
ncbi:oxygen-independent coproporphyrinogen III oxidase [Synechococcus sp. PCC 7335]|uniref:oxygen-independent coproporphyrinogen III oxidase n=1 Tax=Synechococcus sp. (strain ATCC 29403 / PCC 7335) TaxID=91464 RepID=UPI00017EB900|nr:oxygen-independent coproporphyrinogen III oxidase [Synechococcus sp. PCC 7335]EDX83225.1 oxygen-independent coproporphyrinogen III oxidase [Synechococcus sp. PCC 7335]